MEYEARRLNEDIEFGPRRMRFDPGKAKPQDELVFQRTMRRDL